MVTFNQLYFQILTEIIWSYYWLGIYMMSIVRHFFITILLSGLLIGQACASTLDQQYSRNFWNPVYQGHSLDYCSADGKECGPSIANRYCQMMGYEVATQQVVSHDVGNTRHIVGGRGCKGLQCKGFSKIRCVSKFKHKPIPSYYYRTQTFVFPRFNHRRVDWCYQNGHGCGGVAAHSFCRRMGYMQAKKYTIDPHISETRTLGNHQLCLGHKCNAFRSISCYR